MNILVTGSSGFIARFLIPRLEQRGHTVVGLDKRTGLAFGERFRFVHGNILDDAAVDSAMRTVDLVIHLAAEHKDFGVPERLYHQVNVDGTENLLRHAARHDIRSFMFFSSVAVYGDSAVPTNERLEPAPDSPYGESKLGAERKIEAWVSAQADRRVIVVRPTVVFGPHNYANMYRLIQAVAKHRYVGVGSGANIKSIAYVENVAEAAVYLMERIRPGVEIYNYADAPHMTTLDLVTSIARSLPVKLPSIRVPTPLALACAFPFDVLAKITGRDFPLTAKRIEKFTKPTHHEAEKILRSGFEPPFSIEAGIQETVRWYSANQHVGKSEELGSDTV